MKLSIRNIPGTPLDVALISHIEKRAEFALAGLRQHIRQVQVGLLEVPGHRGSADRRCQVQLLLNDEAPLVVTETSSDELSAINRALSVAGHLATRRVAHRGRQHMTGVAAVHATSNAV
jgi:hypothetical protein